MNVERAVELLIFVLVVVFVGYVILRIVERI